MVMGVGWVAVGAEVAVGASVAAGALVAAGAEVGAGAEVAAGALVGATVAAGWQADNRVPMMVSTVIKRKTDFLVIFLFSLASCLDSV